MKIPKTFINTFLPVHSSKKAIFYGRPSTQTGPTVGDAPVPQDLKTTFVKIVTVSPFPQFAFPFWQNHWKQGVFEPQPKFWERSDHQNFKLESLWTPTSWLPLNFKCFHCTIVSHQSSKDGSQFRECKNMVTRVWNGEIFSNFNVSRCCNADSDLHLL